MLLRNKALRLRRVGVTSVLLLLLILLAVPLTPAAAAAETVLTAEIRSSGGALMGTAYFIPAGNGMIVDLKVQGFEPVGGDHRFVITAIGQCFPWGTASTGAVLAVLPPVQFFPNGTANYRVTTTAINYSTLVRASGSSLQLYANTSPQSEVIACGVIVAKGTTPAPTPKPTPAPGTPPVVGPARTVTAAAGLRMRNAPNLAGAVVLTLGRGQTVYPIGNPTVNQGISWLPIRVSRSGFWYQGYVAENYLSGSSAPGTPPPAQGRWQVIASGLNLRSGPGLGYPIRRTVPYGTIIQDTAVDQWVGGILWTQVRVDGLAFWAAKQYLKAI